MGLGVGATVAAGVAVGSGVASGAANGPQAVSAASYKAGIARGSFLITVSSLL